MVHMPIVSVNVDLQDVDILSVLSICAMQQLLKSVSCAVGSFALLAGLIIRDERSCHTVIDPVII